MKNGNKKASQKDTKGRFLPGWSGGPGRGKKTKADVLEEIENVITDGMRSTDLGDRLKAAALAFKFEAIKKPDEKLMSDSDLAFLRLITNLAAYNLTSGVEIMGRMLKVCPGCAKLKSENEEERRR